MLSRDGAKPPARRFGEWVVRHPKLFAIGLAAGVSGIAAAASGLALAALLGGLTLAGMISLGRQHVADEDEAQNPNSGALDVDQTDPDR
jgi:hypothetical protein